MVNGVSLNANNFNYAGVVSSGHGKLYVPVSQSNVIYAHFDHVTGVAAKPNQKGVSISKIQILNSLLMMLFFSESSGSSLAPCGFGLPLKEGLYGSPS